MLNCCLWFWLPGYFMSNLLLELCFVTWDLLFCSNLQLNETPYNDTSICVQCVPCEVPDTWYMLCAGLGVPVVCCTLKTKYHFFTSDLIFYLVPVCFSHSICSLLFIRSVALVIWWWHAPRYCLWNCLWLHIPNLIFLYLFSCFLGTPLEESYWKLVGISFWSFGFYFVYFSWVLEKAKCKCAFLESLAVMWIGLKRKGQIHVSSTAFNADIKGWYLG